MSSIQIVPDDVGVAAAQIISDAVGNFSLHNRLNSSDLEKLALEGAQEISGGLRDVARVVEGLNVPLTILLYVVSIALAVWVVLTLVEKTILVVTYFAGNKRRGRGWGRGPCGSCCSKMKRWCIGRNPTRSVRIRPEVKNMDYTLHPLKDDEHLNSKIPPPNEHEISLV
ncbi:uncharacterized protein LOC110855385 [Folsomia candida]|uniref:uncharacterized protein LOC110855385 n=1 Tax=Folsomia candida TaxID=158441 RepID=UPI000B8FAF4F|nr:uncharacterized protein LOC110855385 [Folsomia candida]XP_021959507.1 uncharacterized protein LOC110855385 [Folsomia candida]